MFFKSKINELGLKVIEIDMLLVVVVLVVFVVKLVVDFVVFLILKVKLFVLVLLIDLYIIGNMKIIGDI